MTGVQEYMESQGIGVVVPTYNNGGTVVDILRRTLCVTSRVLLVCDGCTDGTEALVANAGLDKVKVLSYQPNRGKGHALSAGFAAAREMGWKHVVTLDSDGQHFPEDIPLLLEAFAASGEKALIVGERPLDEVKLSGGSSFANRFSNFWFTVQTGRRLRDTQTGFRLYPLASLRRSGWLTSRYEAELELLVLSAWRGVKIVSVPVRVHYPPQEERVSHFRPAADFARISLLNTVLTFGAVVYGWPRIIWNKITKRKQ